MGMFGWILFGFIIGLIARAIVPERTRDPLGLIGTSVLGIIGALVGGWIGEGLGLYGPDDGGGYIAATVGAIVLVAVYRLTVLSRSLPTETSADSAEAGQESPPDDHARPAA